MNVVVHGPGAVPGRPDPRHQPPPRRNPELQRRTRAAACCTPTSRWRSCSATRASCATSPAARRRSRMEPSHYAAGQGRAGRPARRRAKSAESTLDSDSFREKRRRITKARKCLRDSSFLFTGALRIARFNFGVAGCAEPRELSASACSQPADTLGRISCANSCQSVSLSSRMGTRPKKHAGHRALGRNADLPEAGPDVQRTFSIPASLLHHDRRRRQTSLFPPETSDNARLRPQRTLAKPGKAAYRVGQVAKVFVLFAAMIPAFAWVSC